MSDGWTGLAQSTSHLPALGMGMVGMRERQEDRDMSLGIARERLGMQEETAKQTALYHQAQLAQKPPVPKHLQVMNPSMISSAKVATEAAFGKDGVEVLSPLFDLSLKHAESDPNSTFGDNLAGVKSAWPTLREDIGGRIQKKLESGKLNPDQQKKLSALYDSVMYDKDGSLVLDQGVYKNTKASMDAEAANSKAATVAAQQEGLTSRADLRDERIREIAEENRQLRRDLAAQKGGGGSGDAAEKATQKATDKTVRRIDDQIRLYDKEISEYTKRMDKADSADSKWYQDAIDARVAEKEKAIATKNAVLNDGEGVQWGGDSQGGAQGQPDKFGYTIGEVRQGHKYIGNDKWEPVK
jgi:hypothetical protein